MKLIQIVALAAVMVGVTMAQNTGNGQDSGTAASTKKGTNQAPQNTAPGGKPSAGTTSSQKSSGTSADDAKIKIVKKSGQVGVADKKTTSAPAATQSKNASTPANGKNPVVVTPTKGSPTAGNAPTTGNAKSAATPANGKAPVVATQGKTVQGTTAANGASKTSTGAKQTPVVVTPGKTAAKSATSSAKIPASTQKKAPATQATKKQPPPPQPKIVQQPSATSTAPPPPGKPVVKATAAGRRDPFVSPIREKTTGGPVGPTCSTGKRCLFIPELVVQGTVRDTSGKMVAVVVNRARHTYFLRESDQVFNGSVQKITTDSVVFREFVTDNLGRETAHEVVKRVGTPTT